MNMEPLPFAKASGTVKENYQQIIDAFGIGYLPMFFQYLGLFPQYLDYITVQIVGSLNNRKFIALTSEVGSSLASLMAEHFSKSGDTLAWRQRYRYSPQFYYFQEDMKRIHDANIKLVFLFIALREAVKGWAVAARISGIEFLQYPSKRDTSILINSRSTPILASEAIQAQNAEVDLVSGATFTSKAFIQSLNSALSQAM